MTHAGQASDELAMIYAGLVFLHATLEVEYRERTTWSKLLAPLLEGVYALSFTAAYIQFPQYFGAFVCSYLLLVIITFLQTYRVYRRYCAEADDAGWYQRMLFQFSFGTYAIGFVAFW